MMSVFFSSVLSKCCSVLKHCSCPSSSIFGLTLELHANPVEGIPCCNLQCLLSVGVDEVSSAVLAVDE